MAIPNLGLPTIRVTVTANGGNIDVSAEPPIEIDQTITLLLSALAGTLQIYFQQNAGIVGTKRLKVSGGSPGGVGHGNEGQTSEEKPPRNN